MWFLYDSIKLSSSRDIKDKTTQPPNDTVVKKANEAGIAGFVFGLVIPLQWNFLLLNTSQYAPVENQLVGIGTILIWTVTGLILSLIGMSKVGIYYQKGLANWGFVFNFLFALFLIYELTYN